MRRRAIRGGVAAVLLASVMLTGCTERVNEKCSGKNGEYSCTFRFATSTSQWSTDLEGRDYSEEMIVNGTVTLEAGSGTLLLRGGDTSYEYPLTAEEPLVIEDLAFVPKEFREERSIYLQVIAEPQIDGFSAEIGYVSR